MARVRVKICGARTYEEARTALDCGADALGFNFWPKSARFVEPHKAQEIIHRLPPFVTCVGVFVNEDEERIKQIAEQTRIQTVQLHGDEEPEFCKRFGSIKLIKAFRVAEDFSIETMKSFSVSAFLLDAKVKGEYGGTGQRFDWRIAIEAKQIAPIILAGGINIENVVEAIQYVRPYAVDVCSGVEAEPGRKDLLKLREFMLEVERANRIAEGENQPQITQITRI
jgi:phosphoribosylanthranilate isomerase